MIGLVDCNNFFVSCEKIFRPDLKDKPVVVLSNNDGCVISRSQEAKALGIKMGEPYFQIQQLCKKNNVVAFSSNYSLYADISTRVMDILSNYTDEIELYSIDEAFLSFSHVKHEELEQYLREIKHQVFKQTSIPVCVGVGKTKVLAKLANSEAKKNRENGIFIINDANYSEVLKNNGVGEVWGVGRKSADKLKQQNITTVFDLVNTDSKHIRRLISLTGLKLQQELSGISCLELEEVEPDKKNITSSRSFGEPITDFEVIAAALSNYVMNAHRKLYDQSSYAKGVMVMLRSNKFQTKYQYYGKTEHLMLSDHTDSLVELTKAATLVLKNIFKPGILYHKVGVMLFDIKQGKQMCFKLFEEEKQKNEKLSKLISDLNKKHGKNVLALASTISTKKWKMKREKLSPQYTSNWEHLKIVT